MIKEIIKLLKDPKTFVTLFLGPIFFTLLIGGVYFNDYMNDISLVVLDEDNTSMSRMVITEFEENERFYVSKFVSNFDELKDVIDSKEAMCGIYIPKGFKQDVKSMKSAKIPIFLDSANVTIANTALGSASEILNTLNAGATIQILEAKNIDPKTSYNLGKFYNMESRILYDPKMTYKGYIMPGIILVFVQQLFLSAYIPNIIRDRKNILSKSFIYSIVSSASFAVCTYILKNIFNIYMTGSIFISSIYTFMFMLSLTGGGVLIAIIFRTPLKVTQFTMILSMPTFLTAGYVWPVNQMPENLLSIVKGLWPLIYAICPIRDILIKNTSISLFKEDILSMLIFGLIWTVPTYIVFHKIFKKGEDMCEQEGAE